MRCREGRHYPIGSSVPRAVWPGGAAEPPLSGLASLDVGGAQVVVHGLLRHEAKIGPAGEYDALSRLARELGLSRQAIYDARNRFPDAPKKHEDGKRENLAAWQEFVGAKLIGKDHATKNLSDLKAELMREQIRLARSKNERESGDVIDREVVEAMLVTLGQKLNLLLRLKLEVELGPRGVGMNAAELNVEGGVILQEIREVINANIATFEGEALDRSRDGEAIV